MSLLFHIRSVTTHYGQRNTSLPSAVLICADMHRIHSQVHCTRGMSFTFLRMILCLDPTHHRGIFTAQQSSTLYTISYPFNWTVNILLAFYWHDLLIKFNSGRFNFPMVRLKIPCAICIILLFVLEIFTDIMRWSSTGSAVGLVVTINGVVYILVLVPTLIFFLYTSLKLVYYLKASKNLAGGQGGNGTKIMRLAFLNLMNCFCMILFLSAVVMAISPAYKTPAGWIYVKTMAILPIAGIGLCQSFLFRLPNSDVSTSGSRDTNSPDRPNAQVMVDIPTKNDNPQVNRGDGE